MRLKITVPEDTPRQTARGRRLYSGGLARTELDGKDISYCVSRLVLTVDSQEAITADLRFYVSGLDVETPTLVKDNG